MSDENLQKALTELLSDKSLDELISQARTKVSLLCEENKPPKMSVKAQPSDDDIVILAALSEANKIIKDLLSLISSYEKFILELEKKPQFPKMDRYLNEKQVDLYLEARILKNKFFRNMVISDENRLELKASVIKTIKQNNQKKQGETNDE